MEGKLISEISSKVQNFLRKYVRSVWQLEVILYVRDSKAPLTSSEIARALYLSPEAIERALSTFEKEGLVKSVSQGSKAYYFAPANSDLRDSIDQTAGVYLERRVALINAIVSSSIKSFSQAFVIKEGDA